MAGRGALGRPGRRSVDDPDGSRDAGRTRLTTVAISSAPPSVARRDAALSVNRGLFQLVVLLWCYALYDILRTSVSGAMTVGVAHAAQVAGLERLAGLNVERMVQQAALHVPWLVDACNFCYSWTHLLAPPVVLVVLYRRAPARYRPARNAFGLLLGLALLCFWLYPVAPPRLVPGPSHLADTTQTFSLDRTPFADLVSAKSESTTPTWVGSTNPMAAMPSLHVGWAVWTAIALWPLLRRRATRLVVAAYPAFMFVSVLVTGNHWLLDGVAGAVLAACTFAMAARYERRRGTEAPIAAATPPALLV